MRPHIAPAVKPAGPIINLVRQADGSFGLKFNPRNAVSGYVTAKRLPFAVLSRFARVMDFLQFAEGWKAYNDQYWNSVFPNGGGWVRQWGPCVPRTGNGPILHYDTTGTPVIPSSCIRQQSQAPQSNPFGRRRAATFFVAPIGTPFYDWTDLWTRSNADANDAVKGTKSPLPVTKVQGGAPDPFSRGPLVPFGLRRQPAPWFKPELPHGDRKFRNRVEARTQGSTRLNTEPGAGGTKERTVFPEHKPPYRPPAKGEQERKINFHYSKAILKLWEVATGLTEYDDFISIMFDNIIEADKGYYKTGYITDPKTGLTEKVIIYKKRNFHNITADEYKLFKRMRTGRTMKGARVGEGMPYWTLADKTKIVYDYWKRVDWNTAIPALLKNQISDAIIGRVLGEAGRAAVKQDLYGLGLATEGAMR